jgi:hypothetical protein
VASGAVVIPVGPGPQERARLVDLLEALGTYMPGASAVLVADVPENVHGLGAEVIPNPRRGEGVGILGGLCAATLAGLRWAHERDAPWALRLDTDALVVGQLDLDFEDGVGVVGSCFHTCDGDPRDFGPWTRQVRKLARPVWTWLRPPLRGRFVMRADPAIRDAAQRALATDYIPGQHCLGGGYAVSRPLLDALDREGWLHHERRWLRTRLGEDVMVGLLAAALGFGLRDDPRGFGLRYRGLPDAPERLARRGFAVVHSVKGDDEDAVRAYFAEQRA